MKKIFSSLIIAFLILNLPTQAQNFSGSMMSIGGGLYIPSTSSKNIGTNIFFSYGSIFNKNVGVRGEIQYHNVPFSNSNSFSRWVYDRSSSLPVLRDQAVKIKNEISEYGINARFDAILGNLAEPNKVIYYGTFGLGLDISGGSVKAEVTYTPNFQISPNDDINSSSSFGPNSEIIFGLGGGVGYRISRTESIVFELRLEIIGESVFFPMRIGLTFLPPL